MKSTVPPKLETARATSSRRRKPPRPVFAEVPAQPPAPRASPEPPAPRVAYFVRCGRHAVEIGTAEDWWILAQHVDQPARDALEIWALDQGEPSAPAVRIHPSEAEEARALIALHVAATFPREGLASDLPEDPAAGRAAAVDHPEPATMARLYRRAKGESPEPPKPDGPAKRP